MHIAALTEDHLPALLPEHKLVATLLENAFSELTHKQTRSQAYAWIMGTPGDLHPFSFDWACEVLELDPATLRVKAIQTYLSGKFKRQRRRMCTY